MSLSRADEARLDARIDVPVAPPGWVAMEDSAEVFSRLLKLAADKHPDLKEAPYKVAVTRYLDNDRHAAEVQHFFKEMPVLVGLTAEMPNSGDFKTYELVGVPLLIIRGDDGVVRGFHNSCLHRGTGVVQQERGCAKRRITCPWHAWSYDTRGVLKGLPYRDGFPGLEVNAVGLKPIAVAERYGLIFARLEGEGEIDVDEHLGGLADQVSRFGWNSGWEVADVVQHTINAPVNWKLLFDTFLENYHLGPLHGDVLPFALSNVAAYDYYGLHAREVFANAPASDPHCDDPATAMSPVYLVFPNLVMLPGLMSAMGFTCMPGFHAGESTLINFFLYPKGQDPQIRKLAEVGNDFSFHNIVVPQDIPMTQAATRAMLAGSVKELTFGMNEGALHHFHQKQDEVLRAAGYAV